MSRASLFAPRSIGGEEEDGLFKYCLAFCLILFVSLNFNGISDVFPSSLIARAILPSSSTDVPQLRTEFGILCSRSVLRKDPKPSHNISPSITNGIFNQIIHTRARNKFLYLCVDFTLVVKSKEVFNISKHDFDKVQA